jgi:hypothetical protein
MENTRILLEDTVQKKNAGAGCDHEYNHGNHWKSNESNAK